MRWVGAALLAMAVGVASVSGQIVTIPGTTAVGGVMISPEGVLQMRKQVPTPTARQKDQVAGMAYVSLGKALAAAGEAQKKGEAVPRELATLKGLVRIEYVFVYPGEIVIAGPAEGVNDTNTLQPVGKATGRPVVQLDDLAVALQATMGAKRGRGGFYGCSLDLPPGAGDIARGIGAKFPNASRGKVIEELKKALGPMRVQVIGVPADTRAALAMVAADYRLKRICLGIDAMPGVGNALGSEVASWRVWFEPAYEPVGVAEDGMSYVLAGPRLKVEAGPQEFKKGAATKEAEGFALRMSSKIDAVAERVTEVADLQNVADVFLVATLIWEEDLDGKAKLDLKGLLGGYTPAKVKEATSAELLVRDTGSVIAQGGVALTFQGVGRGRGTVPVSARWRPTEGWGEVRK